MCVYVSYIIRSSWSRKRHCKKRSYKKNGKCSINSIYETYIFVSTDEFKKLIEDNALYEFDIHHNHYYGVPKKQLNEKISQGKTVIKDVDVNGTENLVKILQKDMKVVTIFLRVPKEELRKRLEERIDQADQKEIELRLSRFDYEESKMDNYDYVIENTDVEKTINQIMEIIKKG